MHEVSLVENIVALLEDERRRHEFSRVRMIRVCVGALGHVEPDVLRFRFDAGTSGTIAGEGSCSACHLVVPINDRFAACPLCGNVDVRIIAGEELHLAELEVE